MFHSLTGQSGLEEQYLPGILRQTPPFFQAVKQEANTILLEHLRKMIQKSDRQGKSLCNYNRGTRFVQILS